MINVFVPYFYLFFQSWLAASFRMSLFDDIVIIIIIFLTCKYSWLSFSDSTGPPIASQSRTPSVQNELIMLSIPAIAGQAIEPLAQLMETAYVGRLGRYFLVNLDLQMFYWKTTTA